MSDFSRVFHPPTSWETKSWPDLQGGHFTLQPQLSQIVPKMEINWRSSGNPSQKSGNSQRNPRNIQKTKLRFQILSHWNPATKTQKNNNRPRNNVFSVCSTAWLFSNVDTSGVHNTLKIGLCSPSGDQTLAMENTLSIGYVPIKTSIYRGCSIAMFDYQMV